MDKKPVTINTDLEWQTAWSCSETSQMTAVTQAYDPIRLEQMEAVALLDRIDTKYILTTPQLLCTLMTLKDEYWMLEVKGRRLNHYRTLYFDTPDFALYRMHVNGRLDRYKVRSREYTDSALSFLEVKHKTNTGRTVKARLRTAEQAGHISQEAVAWMKNVYPYGCRSLEPKQWNSFTRLTLVSKTSCERLTLDIDLAFFTDQKVAQLGDLAVAEIKLPRGSKKSAFAEQMRLQKIQPAGLSKYCLGVALLYDNVKKNALKPKLLKVSKMVHGVMLYE